LGEKRRGPVDKTVGFRYHFDRRLKGRSDTEKAKRQVAPDLLRIAAALGIVLYHYTFRGHAAEAMSILSFPYLGAIFKYGYLGVDVFFLLSGYTILASALRKDFPAFVRARVLRLYPAFWIAVCLTTGVTLCLGGNRYHVYLPQFLVNLTMLCSFVNVPWIDGAYWFLAVILKFYFWISIWILFRMLRFREFLMGGWLMLSFFLFFFPGFPWGRLFIPDAAPFLISGMAFYEVRKKGWNGVRLTVIAGGFLLGLGVLSREMPQFIRHYKTPLSFTVLCVFLFVLYGLMTMVSRLPYGIDTTSKGGNVLITLGAATYPLYLIHENIGYMIFNRWGRVFDKDLLLIFTIAGMVLTSLVIVLYIEPVVRRFLERWMQWGIDAAVKNRWRKRNGS